MGNASRELIIQLCLATAKPSTSGLQILKSSVTGSNPVFPIKNFIVYLLVVFYCIVFYRGGGKYYGGGSE